MAWIGQRRLHKLGGQYPQMIRIDAAWLAAGAAQPHTAYIFANKRANRLKILVHDGFGIWLAARRLHQGKFIWASGEIPTVSLQHAQLDALVLGLPWQRLGPHAVISMV